MLVLTRKAGERIVIGDNIVVTVVQINRRIVSVGVEAPREIPIHRESASGKNQTKKWPLAIEPVIDKPAESEPEVGPDAVPPG